MGASLGTRRTWERKPTRWVLRTQAGSCYRDPGRRWCTLGPAFLEPGNSLPGSPGASDDVSSSPRHGHGDGPSWFSWSISTSTASQSRSLSPILGPPPELCKCLPLYSFFFNSLLAEECLRTPAPGAKTPHSQMQGGLEFNPLSQMRSHMQPRA